MPVAHLSSYADKCYYSRKDIKAIQDESVTAMIPQGDKSVAGGKGLFYRSAFKYAREQDIYICPRRQELQNRVTVMEDGLEQDMYFNNIACSNCSSRAKCEFYTACLNCRHSFLRCTRVV